MTGDGIRILVVEDDPDDRYLAKYAFEREFPLAQVDFVQDGVLALEYLFGVAPGDPGGIVLPHEAPELGASSGRWHATDLIFLDLSMPRIGGLELLDRLKRDPRTIRIPVVVMTTSQDPREIERAAALGSSAYVEKSVSIKAHRAELRATCLPLFERVLALRRQGLMGSGLTGSGDGEGP